VLVETPVNAEEMEVALARTLARHGELVAGRRRRRNVLAGVGLAVVAAAAISIPLLTTGSDSQPVRTVSPPVAAQPGAAVPSTAVLGSAATARREATIESTSISPDGATIAIVFACETSTDRVTAVDPTFSGATLIVVPTIESADRSVPCAGPSTATTTIQIPPEFRGRPLTVTVGRP